jgi:hypothetical protein
VSVSQRLALRTRQLREAALELQAAQGVEQQQQQNGVWQPVAAYVRAPLAPEVFL